MAIKVKYFDCKEGIIIGLEHVHVGGEDETKSY